MFVDTFMFYNEFDVLEARLEILDRYVDRFVLVESEVNHVGGSKPLFFQGNKERYKKWWPKIVHVVVAAAESPKDKNPWCREKFQRECILRGLEAGRALDGTEVGAVPNESIVMVSDVDEIPDLRVVPYEKLPHLINSVHMWMFEYSFDYMFTGEPWFGTVITNCEMFKNIGPNGLRDNRWKFPSFQCAGWHMSSFGNAEHIANKYKTYAHALDNGNHPRLTDPIMIDVWQKHGIHSDGQTSLVPRPPEVPLPPISHHLLERFVSA
jgi:beta-1,4-mannosyl-glycoprotein beta-1,4-N-acetylglucosaminyltransferase